MPDPLTSAFGDRLQKLLKPDSVSRDVRRFLAEAHGFLTSMQTTGDLSSYTLGRALASRLGEIDGTPSNPKKPNRIARIDVLLQYSAVVIGQAMLLDEEDLGAETVRGLVPDLNRMLDGFGKALGVSLPAELPGNDFVDGVQGQVGKAGAAGLLKGSIDGLPSPGDVL